MSQQQQDKQKISSPTYHRFGFLLIAIGTAYGIDSYFNIHIINQLWPLLITILGIGFLGIFVKRGKRESAYFGTGVYLTGFSALALFCNFTTWKNLATYWPMFILFLGIAFIGPFFFDRSKRLLLLIGLLLSSVSVVFYFIFSVSSTLWWTSFIFTGLSVLIAERAK
jgi:hypothetical protein